VRKLYGISPFSLKRTCSRCAQHLRRIRGCDARIRRESGAYVTQMRKIRDVRHVARVCCAQLPREGSATRDVTFGPLCIYYSTVFRAILLLLGISF
jgi:hypothetical protein